MPVGDRNDLVAQSLLWCELALTRLRLGDGFDLGSAEGREVVHDGDAGLDFGIS